MKILDIKGTRVPALGLGTFDMRSETCVRAVREALAIGYRHIDTARMYGNERDVGRGIRESGVPRDEIFLVTKIWPDDLAPRDVRRAREDSLRNLATDYVDLLLIHWPSRTLPLGPTLEALAAEREAGHTRHIGVSNFTVALLREAIETHGADLLTNQVEYHPYLSQRPVRAELARHDMMLTAYRPIGKGRFDTDPVLARIGARHGKSGNQTALRWLMQQDAVAAIPKAARRDHLEHNFDIFDFALDDAEMAAIDALMGDGRMIDPAMGPDWDEG